MLTSEEREEILEETKRYPRRRAACIDALQIIQKHRGWISDESIDDVAGILDMTNDEVDSVATFYSRIYRKPVGRNVILLCDSMVCMTMNGESIYDYLSSKLGIGYAETTPDGRFTLLPISCLGDCDHAPSFMINDDLYNSLTKEGIDELLEKYK